MVGSSKAIPLADGEQIGIKFETDLGKKSLAELRAIPAGELLQATAKAGRFPAVIDGHFLPKTPMDITPKASNLMCLCWPDGTRPRWVIRPCWEKDEPL